MMHDKRIARGSNFNNVSKFNVYEKFDFRIQMGIL